jgi:bifunctional ADP-heptose synthase (sugar kinase/adenylyltransferase)
MLQIYNIERINLSKKNERNIIDYLKNKNKNTLFLVTDFGFGFMSKKIIDFLNTSKINYSLNCHLNSININYNYYNRYKNFMYLTFNKKELVMNFKGDLTFKEKVKLARSVLKKPFAVTVGSRGSFIFNKKLESFFPAIYKDIIDPVGCGDAYFAITSVLMRVTKDLDLINFLGNLYAGMHAMIICNKSFVSQSSFIKKLKVILS